MRKDTGLEQFLKSKQRILKSFNTYMPALTVFSAFIISGSFLVNVSHYDDIGLGLFVSGFMGIFWSILDCWVNDIDHTASRGHKFVKTFLN
ncbi:MAG: hypothetical protein ACOC80_12305 [Petrotogales bacterium]